MLRPSLTVIALLLALGAGYLALACAMQRSVLYPAPPAPASPERLAAIPGAEQIWLESGARKSEAWLLPPLRASERPATLVVFAHGYGELIDDWGDAFAPLRLWGAAVLLVEYPGYGRSAGTPSQSSILAAMERAYDSVRTRGGIDPSRIVAYGRSLGGGAACALARERSVAALVLESTFTSVRPLARGFGLPGFLVRDPFDNLAALRAYPGPVLIIHGERDELIPPEHAAALHAAAPRSRLELLPCGHNDCPRPWGLLRAFLLEHGLLERGDG
jgi:pimeloyl-ACP methyl ester carboxylesterase